MIQLIQDIYIAQDTIYEDVPILDPENIFSSESVMINTLLNGCESLTTSEEIRLENWSCKSLEEALGNNQLFLIDVPNQTVLEPSEMMAEPNSMKEFVDMKEFVMDSPHSTNVFESDGLPVKENKKAECAEFTVIKPKFDFPLWRIGVEKKTEDYTIKNILFTNIYKNHVSCIQKAVIYNREVLLNNILKTVKKYELREKNSNLREIICKIKNHKQQALIHTAVIYMRPDSPNILKALINFGYDSMMKDGKGNTAYHLAAEMKSSHALKALISSRNDGSIKDLTSFTNFEGMNVLHVGVRSQNYDNVELILSNKLVNIDSKTSSSGDTALHIACTVQDMEIAKLLIDNGADMSAHNLSDYSPLQVSVAKNDHAMAAFLISEGSNPNEECVSLTVERNLELAENPLFDSTAEKDSNNIFCNNNAFGLALDVMMFDILAGKKNALKPKEINKTKTKGVLWNKDQLLSLRRILGHCDNWRILLKELNKDHLPDLSTFKKPENVLLNYIDTNKDEILGVCDDQMIKLAELFGSIGLHEAKQVLTAAEE